MRFGLWGVAFVFSAAGCASAPVDTIAAPTVPARAETAPVASLEDAADDPAIWISPNGEGDGRILGTDKQAGLYVYDLTGAQTQFLPAGALNNVDLRQDVQTPAGPRDLAAATNKTDNSVTLFQVDADGSVQEIGRFSTGLEEPYGLCVANRAEGYRVYVTYKTGVVQAFSVFPDVDAIAQALPGLRFETQLEGCVFDEAQSTLFVGEEAAGIWRIPFTGDQPGQPVMIDVVNSGTGLAADVEGLDIWRGAGPSGYLVASAQGQDRFVVYERAAPNRPIGVFSVGPSRDGTVDAVTGTDGLTVTSAALDGYPQGLLVVQDDVNALPGRQQNFKLVDWRDVERSLAGQIGGAPPQRTLD